MKQPSVPSPPRPQNDLRTQLTDRVVELGLANLAAADRRREEVARSGDWGPYRTRIREKIFSAFGPMPFGKAGGALNERLVSAHDTRHCRIENVLFESYPGWEVNATVFVPAGNGPFPAVILPVGHSGKQFESYQIPAQAFAFLGYIAVLFDPPGQASEKQRGNDHFRDGVRSTLFGITSDRFFVLDALRCIDYLESRTDADLSNGVAMSGVSGGGVTTLYASLFDPRITCLGPSCCMNRLADLPVGSVYSACPETFWLGRLRDGIDEIDVALAVAPKPMLYMAGRYDEVFVVDATRRLVQEIHRGYNESGVGERFDYFEDDSGHAYTLEQTRRFAAWMSRWLLHEPETPVPELDAKAFDMLDYETLKCHPSQTVNMFTIHRDLAEAIEAERRTRRGESNEPVAEAVRKLVGVPSELESWSESGPFRLWSQGYSEALARVDGFDMPVSVFRPWPPFRQRMSVLYLDDQGRKHALESEGEAAKLSRMIERDGSVPFPALYVADLPGWGESEPMMTPYQTTWWGSMDRILSYLSYGNGDGILSIISRCAARLAEEIACRHSLPFESAAIVGRGLGGVVAILAGAISELPLSIAAVAAPASFRTLLEAEHYRWPSISFLPGALPQFDLPELVSALAENGRHVLIVNPKDGEGRTIDPEAVRELFGSADVAAGVAEASESERLAAFLDSIAAE